MAVNMVAMDTVIGRKELCGNCSVGFTVGMALVVGFTSCTIVSLVGVALVSVSMTMVVV